MVTAAAKQFDFRAVSWGGGLVTSTKKVGILILSSAAGTAIGFGVFLFVSFALLVYYGDNEQGGHPSEFLKNSLFYGIFGITTLIGFGLGLCIVKKWEKSASSTVLK
jgi:hypothetical protein